MLAGIVPGLALVLLMQARRFTLFMGSVQAMLSSKYGLAQESLHTIF